MSANLIPENQDELLIIHDTPEISTTRAQYVITTFIDFSVTSLGSGLLLTTMNANKYFTKSQMLGTHIMIAGNAFSYTGTSGNIKAGFAYFQEGSGTFISVGAAYLYPYNGSTTLYAEPSKGSINVGNSEKLYGFINNGSNGKVTGGRVSICDYMNT